MVKETERQNERRFLGENRKIDNVLHNVGNLDASMSEYSYLFFEVLNYVQLWIFNVHDFCGNPALVSCKPRYLMFDSYLNVQKTLCFQFAFDGFANKKVGFAHACLWVHWTVDDYVRICMLIA